MLRLYPFASISLSEQRPLNMDKFSVCFCLFKVTDRPFAGTEVVHYHAI